MSNKIYIPYYISNASLDPAQVLPRIFFYNGLKTSDQFYIQYYNTFAGGYQFEDFQSFPYFDNYSGQQTTTGSLSLLFLNEDPVYGTQAPSQSLYDKYWANYITLLYNPKTRIIRMKAVLPFDVYNKLELNDIIQLRSNYYHLRAINDYNLRTGECRVELLGPLLAGAYDGKAVFDNTCEAPPTVTNVNYNSGSGLLTFNYSGSNCCNNPNNVVIRFDFTTGSCPTFTYYNTTISGSIQKNDCTGSYETGSYVIYTISPNTFSSSVSQVDAQNSASAYFNSTSQSYANTYGSCSYNPPAPITSSILEYYTYEGGQFYFTLTEPLSQSFTLSAQADGYQYYSCAGGIIENDNVNSVTFPSGSTLLIVNGETPFASSVTYRKHNNMTVNGTGSLVGGSTFYIGNVTMSLSLNTSCNFYAY